MRKLTAYQLMMLFTAIIGIALVMVWRFNQPSQSGVDNREHTFTRGGGARVMTAGGRYMDVTVYKFNDNREVSWVHETLPPGAAEIELQELLEGDVDVIERAPVLNERGEKAGERVVALFHLFGRGPVPHILLWKNHGGSVYRIEGTSLDQLLEVERTLK